MDFGVQLPPAFFNFSSKQRCLPLKENIEVKRFGSPQLLEKDMWLSGKRYIRKQSKLHLFARQENRPVALANTLYYLALAYAPLVYW